jgi:L-asparaginase
MRRVEVLSTGGTIEKEYDETAQALVNRGSVVNGMLRRLRLADTEVFHRVLMYKDSLELTDDDRVAILEGTRSALERSDGVIILHGTDTLAVTGELLYRELAPTLRVPVVLTGAFRPFELKRTDALQNLTEAVFATRLLEAGVYCVVHGRALAFPGVYKDHDAHTFDRATQ